MLKKAIPTIFTRLDLRAASDQNRDLRLYIEPLIVILPTKLIVSQPQTRIDLPKKRRMGNLYGLPAKVWIMKALLFNLFFIPTLLLAGNGVDGLSEIARALGTGDVATLTNYLDSEIELSVLGEDDFYTSQEAATKLKAFFAKFPATKFAQIHNGVSPTTKAEYCIGNLNAGGKTFRVVIYLTKTPQGDKIKKLSFDQE